MATTKNGVSFFQFNHLAKFSKIQHGIFTRNTGYSNPPFHSLNVSYGTGDDEKKVKKNRQLIAQCMDAGMLIFADQVHSNEILVLTREHEDELNPQSRSAFIGDAMVTHIPGLFLVVQVADCQSVLMCDPIRQVVANVHSGWRGSIDNIIGRTVVAMEKNFGGDPAQIRAGIGPSLGPCCAEFVNYETEIPEKFWLHKDGGNHFDFWSISRDQLMDAGILKENIETCRICTKCHTDLFFSYRGEGTTGRFASVIGLK